MNGLLEEMVRKYGKMTPYEKLSLTERQKMAVEELEKALCKCESEGVGFVQTEEATYAYNDDDVYDFDCSYDDYSCERIELSRLRRMNVDIEKVQYCNNECTVSFYSTTFLPECNNITY